MQSVLEGRCREEPVGGRDDDSFFLGSSRQLAPDAGGLDIKREDALLVVILNPGEPFGEVFLLWTGDKRAMPMTTSVRRFFASARFQVIGAPLFELDGLAILVDLQELGKEETKGRGAWGGRANPILPCRRGWREPPRSRRGRETRFPSGSRSDCGGGGG